MAKFIVILACILSLGGMAFAQEEEIGQERTIVDILRSMFPQATIEVEPITNTLIIKAPPAIQKRIEEMIARLDVYHPQITIEAKFVELTVTDINELGIDLDILNIQAGATLDQGDIDIITDWADADGGFPREPAGTTLWLTRLSPTAFTMVLRALEKQKKANVLSAPRVTTLNRQPATIEVRQNIPYVSEREVENVGTAEFPIWQIRYTIEEEEAGVFLEVTPAVPEGSTLITLDIRPTVRVLTSRITTFTGVEPQYGWPVIDTRTANTTMTIDSGETIVLGGLIHSSVKEMEKKVPLLGDVPFLGHLFRHKHSGEEKRNLLIFLTAYLISPSGEKVSAREIVNGE